MRASLWLSLAVSLGAAPAPCAEPGSTSSRETADEASGTGSTVGTTPDPCEAAALELSAPRGKVLQASRLALRWRAAERGPFEVTILDDRGEPVYTSTTYGHELRVMVSRGAGELGGPHDPELESGRAYRWRVVPRFAEDASRCPTVEFRLLGEEESLAARARFEAESKRLGVGDESRQPAGEIALARAYLEEGFYEEAEEVLESLRQRGWDDPRIDELLRDLFRKTDRTLSLGALSEGSPGE